MFKVIKLLSLFLLIKPISLDASVRFEKVASGYCSTYQKKAQEGFQCFLFTETNDQDSSVYLLGKKLKNLESKKTFKPISWGGIGATHGNYLSLYLMEKRIHWIENDARRSKGLNKLDWSERTYKFTRRNYWDFSK